MDVRAGMDVLICIVDKTLDGAIYMIKGLAFRQLRALGERLPVAHLPVFLDHLEHFFTINRLSNKN